MSERRHSKRLATKRAPGLKARLATRRNCKRAMYATTSTDHRSNELEEMASLQISQEALSEEAQGAVQESQRMEELEGRVQGLEGKVQKLESSVHRALEGLFPRVDTLLRKLEGGSPPSNPAPSTSSAFTPEFQATSTANAQIPPIESEKQKALDEALLEAAKEGRREEVQRLLHEGASVNCHIECHLITPLHWAVDGGHMEVVSVLIAAGADTNCKTSWGSTPLHVAASLGYNVVIPVFVAAGADVNSKNSDGESPLHCAAFSGLEAALLALIAAGADVNSTNNKGETPLHLAAREDDEAVVRKLIAAGATRNIKNKDGKTPHDLTQSATLHNLLA